MPSDTSRKAVTFGDDNPRSEPSHSSALPAGDSLPDPLYEQEALRQALQDTIRQVDEWKATALDVERQFTKKLRQADANLQAVNSRCDNLEDEKKELQREKKKLKEARLRADNPGSHATIRGDFSYEGRAEDSTLHGSKVLFGTKEKSAKWTVRVCLLPSKGLPFPLNESNINAYKRYLSSGLDEMVVVNGLSSGAFTSAVSQAFEPLLQDELWTPLQAKSCDIEHLPGIPLLRPLGPDLKGSKYDFDFLRTHCAVLDAQGNIDTLYIAMQHSIPSWDHQRTSTVILPDPNASSDHGAEQELLNTTIHDTDDILCCLLPDSRAAFQEISRLQEKSSAHVEVIPEVLRRYPKATTDSKYALVLRLSAPRKSPALGFQFGTDASTCDICFASMELNRVKFRIFKDMNGMRTIEGQSTSVFDAHAHVSVSSPSHDGNGVLRTATRPIILENASRIVLDTHPQPSGDSLIFRVALPLPPKTDELSDVESLASVTDVPSLTSATTLSSLGSQLDISEATEELAILLLRDEKLGPLFHTSLQRTAADKVERNYTRLLRKFANDLREEATNPVEHHVGRLVKFRARFISQTLVAAIDPSRQDRRAQLENFLHQSEGREWRMEQYLQSLATSVDFAEVAKITPQPIDSDADVSDDSGEDDNLPKLSQIKDFIMSSEALAILRTRLRDFVSPEEVIPIAMEPSDIQGAHEGPTDDRLSNIEVYLGAVLRLVTRIDQRTISALTKSFLEILRPSIPKGHQRITWVCGCGKPMYSDVQELYEGGATDLKQQLRRAAGAAARSRAGQDTSPQGSTQKQAISSSDTNAMSGSSLVPRPGTNSDANISGTESGRTSAVEPTGPLITSRFLLLCVNGPRFSQLQQVPLTSQQVSVASQDNDRILFDQIRRAYIEVRRSYQPNLHPETPAVVKIFVGAMHRTWKATQKVTTEIFKLLRLQWLVWWIGDDVFFIPKSAEFVRFEVIPLKEEHVPEILESECLPPEEEVLNKNYHYAPCPQEVKNPLLRVPWLHILFEPGAHSSDFWTQRTPKKLAQMLNYPSSNPVIGWGVHIVEGPNWHALTLLVIIFNFLSLLIALIYSVVTIDISAGFAVGSFFLAVETMVMTLALAVVTTSLLYNS